MRAKFVLIFVTSLACCWTVLAAAKEKPSKSAPAVSITGIAPEAFDKLPGNATILVNGKQMTKAAFVAQRESAFKQTEQKARAAASNGMAAFQKRREAFLAGQAAKLKEANAKTQAETDKELAAVTAAQGDGWEANKKQALDLLEQAAKASGPEQEKLATQALGLLKQPVPKP